MLRKTMIVLATGAALTGGLTVYAFAHGGGGFWWRGAVVHGGGFGGGHFGGAEIWPWVWRVRILPGGTAISVAREDLPR